MQAGTGLHLDDIEATERHIRASYSDAIGDAMVLIASSEDDR